MAQEPHNQRLREFTNVPFEIVVFVLTILPFFLLAYFCAAIAADLFQRLE